MTGQFSKTITGTALVINQFSVVIGTTDVVNDLPTRLYDGASNALSFSLPKGQRGTANVLLILGTFDAFTVDVGDPVYIFLYGQRVFAGSAQDFRLNWIGQDGYRQMSVPVTAFEQIFDSVNVFPPKVYVNKSSGFIVTDLFNTFGVGAPISLGAVADGPIIPVAVYSGDRVSDIFTQLATTANFIWGVDPTDLTLYFREQSTNDAPFTLMVRDILWETTDYSQTRDNFRDRQLTRMSFQQNPPSNVLFPGDSTATIFSIPYYPASLVKVNLTTSTQATAVCTFTGAAVDGDYTVIGVGLNSTRYTFYSAIDNTIPNQVLMTGSAAGDAANLADAINANPATIGTSFSFPTLENPVMNAGTATTAFTVTTKTPGSSKSLVEVTSSAAFSWGSVVDGTDGTDDAALTSGADYTWPTLD